MDVVEETEDVGLPLEVWFRILSFLPPNALYPTRRVCLNWRDYVDSDATWMGYIEQYYGQRYAKVGFMADPSSSWQERFWRVTRLHQSWVRGECITEVLAGPYGHVRQMRLDGDRLALNHGDKLHVFDKNRNVRVWKYSEEIPFGHTIPHFDLKGSLIAVPSIHGTFLSFRVFLFSLFFFGQHPRLPKPKRERGEKWKTPPKIEGGAIQPFSRYVCPPIGLTNEYLLLHDA